jgi:hypothetical protein
MLTLIVKDINEKTFIGEVGKKFSTLLNYSLYSKNKDDAQNAIETIIKDNDLVEFNHENDKSLITISSYGIYLIDLSNKVILTNNDYGKINVIDHSIILSLVNNSYEEDNKIEKQNNAKKMLENNYFIIPEETKAIFLNAFNMYHPDNREAFQYLMEMYDSTDYKINKKKLGWKIIQSDLYNEKFYYKLFDYMFNNQIFLSSIEKSYLLNQINENIFYATDNNTKTEREFKKIEELFSIHDAKKEKFYLEKQISNNNKIKQHKI